MFSILSSTLFISLAAFVVGMMNIDTPQTITIALKQYNMHIIEEYVTHISDPNSYYYGMHLTQEGITDIVAPPEEHSEFVSRWLMLNGIENCTNYNDAIMCHTTQSVIDNIFGPNYEIPEDITEYVDFVVGLHSSTIGKRFLSTISKIISSVDSGYVAREVQQRLYSIPDVNVQQSVCAVEYQGESGFSQPGMTLIEKTNNVPVNNITHAVGTVSMPDTETCLDTQMMGMVAANSTVWFWDSPNWLYTFAVNFFNSKEIPNVLSMSWGWAEDKQCAISGCSANTTSQQFVERVNNEYLKIVARGVSIVVASGDAGAPGRTNEGCYTDPNRGSVHPVFPGSSPWVTSVGATFVVGQNLEHNYTTPFCRDNTCANGNEQQTINFNNVSWTAGGGFDIYHTQTPKWQQSAVEHYLQSSVPKPSNFNKNGRGYPDVVMTGHNCPVYQGYLMSVDGTSCSSPLFASVLTILNDHQVSRGKSLLGFVNPILYRMAEDGVFTDMTEGNNACTEAMCCPTRKDGGNDFGYFATTGWDPVTGLGYPNVTKMIQWLDAHT